MIGTTHANTSYTHGGKIAGKMMLTDIVTKFTYNVDYGFIDDYGLYHLHIVPSQNYFFDAAIKKAYRFQAEQHVERSPGLVKSAGELDVCLVFRNAQSHWGMDRASWGETIYGDYRKCEIANTIDNFEVIKLIHKERT